MADDRTPIEVIGRIADAVEEFSSGTELRDDMALVVLRAR
jgi:serine phosphatase RsbU (regulator of sigma subunit)